MSLLLAAVVAAKGIDWVLLLKDVGVPLTTGTEGGPEGATPEPFDVVTPALTALTLEPFSFVATDLK